MAKGQNLARFTGMLQGQRDLTTVGRMLLSELAPLVNAHQGVIYQMESEEEVEGLMLLSSYAGDGQNGHHQRLQVGEGLVGQCAAEKQRLLITDLPEHTVSIRSGLFQAVPRNVIVLPVLFEDRVKAVIELASLKEFTLSHLAFLEQLTASIGIVLNSIEATMQTEGLLKQSQLNWLPNSARRRKSCSKPDRAACSKRPNSLQNKTSKWNARIRKLSKRGARWKKRPKNWR